VSEPTVRTVNDDEVEEALNTVRTAFLSAPVTADELAVRRAQIDPARFHAAFDADGRMCGVARAFPVPLTVPGGEVPTAGVSAVGVLPTHRRQGHLTRLMRAQLADVVDRGEPTAALVAAEYPIYGRFGYGPATEPANLVIDAVTARWREAPTGTTELVDGETWAKVAEELYDRARRAHAGHIGWETARWRIHAGLSPAHDGDDEARARAPKVLWRDEAGVAQGAAVYRITEERWLHNRPASTLTAEPLVAATDRAEHELLRYLAAIDWVAIVRVGLRPQDDPAPLALVDGRTARLDDRSDHLWVRVLDVARALEARRYAAPGSLVIEVADPLGFAAGRFRLDAGPDGAACAPTDASPDLAVTVSALSAAYLGGQSWARLAAAGWVDEQAPGALARAGALFATARLPWCAMTF
jgi:predicted acetyltransferase